MFADNALSASILLNRPALITIRKVTNMRKYVPLSLSLAIPALLLACSAVVGKAAEETTVKRPNILFCIADDWGWPHAGAYGAKEWVKTPAFDRLAREGVLFENCFTSNPKCCPSRASMVAGRNTWQMKEAVDHIVDWPKEFVSYVDLLDDAGYYVGLTGKGWGPGNWKSAGRKYNPAGPSYDRFKIEPPLSGISNKDYARNFIEDFMSQRPSPETPFCFWLGGHEPHRAYEDGSGVRAGKNLALVELPRFYPNRPVIRSDMLDYALEVEHFDRHVGRCLDYLDSIGELDNTIVVMTSDHGMPFPRVKGQIYEISYHIPLAVRWGRKGKPGRKIEDFINVRDFAPTFLEAAGLPKHQQITGRSFLDILTSDKEGFLDPDGRGMVLIGKERHDLGRPHNWGYPVRAIRTTDFLYVHNYEPDRWPAGNPETGYRNCDGSPTKDLLTGGFDRWYWLSFGKRPEQELYRISSDPGCIDNVANQPEYAATVSELRSQMEKTLKEEGDLRALGKPEWFDTIEYIGSKKHAWDTWMENQNPPK